MLFSIFILSTFASAEKRQARQAGLEDVDMDFFAEAAQWMEGDYYEDLAAMEAMLAEFELEYGDYDYSMEDDALLAELDALLEEEASRLLFFLLLTCPFFFLV